MTGLARGRRTLADGAIVVVAILAAAALRVVGDRTAASRPRLTAPRPVIELVVQVIRYRLALITQVPNDCSFADDDSAAAPAWRVRGG
jgi:hypothetical protein